MTVGGSGLVVQDDDQGIVTMRIENPRRANVLDRATLDALVAALAGPLAGDARAVVVGGTGERAFCGGVDLAGEMPGTLREVEALLGGLIDAVDACPCPVIAAVNGAAIGGGLELALACDWRIASTAATFAFPPARLGVVYTPRGLRLLAQAVGSAWARELALSARRIDAACARRIGLVNDLCEPGEVWATAQRAAQAVAEGAPIAVRGMRAILRAQAGGATPAELAALGAGWRDLAYASADLDEGLAAFREHRPPRFTGG